jgi:hypothetical protein
MSSAEQSLLEETVYPIALHGRFRTKERALKSQFSDTLLAVERAYMHRLEMENPRCFDSGPELGFAGARAHSQSSSSEIVASRRF